MWLIEVLCLLFGLVLVLVLILCRFYSTVSMSGCSSTRSPHVGARAFHRMYFVFCHRMYFVFVCLETVAVFYGFVSMSVLFVLGSMFRFQLSLVLGLILSLFSCCLNSHVQDCDSQRMGHLS